MKNWKEYNGHSPEILGDRKKYDNTIYSFDIETTSYIILDDKQYNTIDYLSFSEKEKKSCKFCSCMYIWQFSINEEVYFGRTWDDFKCFLNRLNYYIPYTKIVFVHNLSFEFQYLRNIFFIDNVMSRKKRKVMKMELPDYNIEMRCSYYMSNSSLERLPKTYNLDVEKLKGNLDYSLIRTPETKMTKKELQYCKNDCLVVYKYIQKELEEYKTVKNIPITSTGHVRRELKDKLKNNWSYKWKVIRATNVDGHIYNLLLDCFAGGYTHANWIYADEIIKNVESYDFSSSYPYCMLCFKYPMSKFKKIDIKDVSQMYEGLAYLLKVKFYNIKSKYFNSFISQNKCKMIKKAKYDNGRLIEAEEIEIVLTDVDFRFYLDAHIFDSYEIQECYYSKYDYLPKEYIDFILDKYKSKTELKDVKGMEVEYALQKAKFNSLYGMTVTNNISDRVIYDNVKGWYEEELTNEEIIESLEKEEKKGFLSFAWRCLGYCICKK